MMNDPQETTTRRLPTGGGSPDPGGWKEAGLIVSLETWEAFTQPHSKVDGLGARLERVFASARDGDDRRSASVMTANYIELVSAVLTRSSRAGERTLKGTPDGVRLEAEARRIRTLFIEVQKLLSGEMDEGMFSLLKDRAGLLVRSVRQHLVCLELDLFDWSQARAALSMHQPSVT